MIGGRFGKYGSQLGMSVDLDFREAKFQMTPLMIASLRGCHEIVAYLLKYGANISLRDVKGYVECRESGRPIRFISQKQICI